MIIPGGMTSDGPASPKGEWYGSYYSSMQLPWSSDPRWFRRMSMMMIAAAVAPSVIVRAPAAAAVIAKPAGKAVEFSLMAATGLVPLLGEAITMAAARGWISISRAAKAGLGISGVIGALNLFRMRGQIHHGITRGQHPIVPQPSVPEGVPFIVKDMPGDRISRYKLESLRGVSTSSQQKWKRGGTSSRGPWCDVHRKSHWCQYTR